ncbi:hypothetical protein V8V91_01145 [Algoriphagus halophilus]
MKIAVIGGGAAGFLLPFMPVKRKFSYYFREVTQVIIQGKSLWWGQV